MSEAKIKATIAAAEAHAAILRVGLAEKGIETKVSVMNLATAPFGPQTETEMRDSFRVGAYTAEISFDTATYRQVVRWLPKTPAPKSWSKQETAQYRAGRDAFPCESVGASRRVPGRV